MSTAALFWMIVFALATLLFFVTAVVITVIGIRDLRDLLSGSSRQKEKALSDDRQ